MSLHLIPGLLGLDAGPGIETSGPIIGKILKHDRYKGLI